MSLKLFNLKEINYTKILFKIFAFINKNYIKTFFYNSNVSVYMEIAVTQDSVDLKEVIANLDSIVKTLSDRLNQIEQENYNLKLEIERSKDELNGVLEELKKEKDKNENLYLECTRLLERIKDLEEKLEKEKKRNSLLELENARALDEIKRLKKEKNEFKNGIHKEKMSISKKIINYFRKKG